jgi:hypothetical protein
VHARADQRFGHDDFTLWPQFYHPDLKYLSAIPQKPASASDSLALLWYNISSNDIVPHSGSTVAGFGELSPRLVEEFDHLQERVVARLKQQAPDFKTLPSSLQSMFKLMNHTFLCLRGCPTTLQELQFTLAEFQRYLLELIGALDYLEIYELRITAALSTRRTSSPQTV